jgi:predicted component of type VI protein secretion system
LKTFFRLAVILGTVLPVLSCAPKPAHGPKAGSDLEPAQWRYEKDAIRLVFKADPKLNSHRGIPHPLHLCIYQLRDPNMFNQLAAYQDGLYLLLSCGTFDASVTGFRSESIQIGQVLTMTMDRAEGTRYVGIAAGYYQIERERIIRFMEIPVEVRSKGSLRRTKYAVPGVLNVEILLGPQQIEKIEAIHDRK